MTWEHRTIIDFLWVVSCLEPSIHLLFRDETWIQRSRTDDMEQITDESKELTLDLWLAKDNRFLNPKSSYKRILMAPPCRLIQKKSQKKPTWSAMWITFCWDRKRFQSTASRVNPAHGSLLRVNSPSHGIFSNLVDSTLYHLLTDLIVVFSFFLQDYISFILLLVFFF